MEFEMFSKAGDRACQTQLNKIVKFIEKGKRVTPDIIYTMYVDAMKKIAVKHGEVYDTEPEYHMRARIRKALETNCYDEDKFL